MPDASSFHDHTTVVWLSFHENVDSLGPWDTGTLQHLFDGRLFCTGRNFHQVVANSIPSDIERAVVVLPARHHASAEDIERLNAEMAHLLGVVLILVGDEEHLFPWKQLQHPNLRLWVMLPDRYAHADAEGWAFFFGDGWKADTPDLVPLAAPDKNILWSFSGQATNPVRKQAVNGLTRARSRVPGVLRRTAGFTQGISREEYIAELVRTWVAPCPGGPATPDTFRLYEALECGAIPILLREDYWDFAFGSDIPPTWVSDWEGVGGTIEALLTSRQWWANSWQDWYGKMKWTMAQRLDSDLVRIGVPATPAFQTTTIITTSPSPLNPSIEQISQVLDSARAVTGHLNPVVIVADGPRNDLPKDRSDAYEEYLRQVYWRAGRMWSNVLVTRSTTNVHQAEGVRRAMRYVTTPNVMVLEHDTPLVTDEPIDFEACEALVAQRAVDVLRFHHEAHVHPEHEYLMIDHETIEMMGVPLRRTRQWSQRPHLAGVGYYTEMLQTQFSPKARCFIEDRMHSVASSHPDEHRLAIYHPETGNVKRSFHLDGRQGDPKHDDEQVW